MASVTINVLDPEFYVDPWQAYRWLRDEAPVYWDPVQKLWVISRYADVLGVEKDTARYSSAEGSRPLVDQREDTSMINMNDPAHQEQRRLVSRRFTPRAVRAHESRVREIVREILDEVTPLGQCEAVEAIASRLPAIMISDLLGYPRELWERVRYWSEQTMVLSGQTSPEGPPHEIHPGLLGWRSASCSRSCCGGCRTGSWPAPASPGSSQPPSPAPTTGSASRSPRAGRNATGP